MEKRVQRKKSGKEKQVVVLPPENTDKLEPLWVFDKLDRNGMFAFDLSRDDFDHHEVLEKIISYSNMKWSDIKKQTHDGGKSKHHYLDYMNMSSEAKDRISAMQLENETEAIFSFSLQNKLRIIGFRDGAKFHAVWYDPNHAFYPVKR